MSKTVEKTVLPSPDKLPKDHLRKVEKDVLIAKKLRTLGMQLCEEYVQGSELYFLYFWVMLNLFPIYLWPFDHKNGQQFFLELVNTYKYCHPNLTLISSNFDWCTV